MLLRLVAADNVIQGGRKAEILPSSLTIATSALCVQNVALTCDYCPPCAPHHKSPIGGGCNFGRWIHWFLILLPCRLIKVLPQHPRSRVLACLLFRRHRAGGERTSEIQDDSWYVWCLTCPSAVRTLIVADSFFFFLQNYRIGLVSCFQLKKKRKEEVSVYGREHCFHEEMLDLLQIQHWHWYVYIHSQWEGFIWCDFHIWACLVFVLWRCLLKSASSLLSQEGSSWHVKPQWCNSCKHVVVSFPICSAPYDYN